MFCHQCGTEANPGDRFCKNCGAKLLITNEASAQDTPQAGPGTKEQLLRDVEQTLSQNPKLTVARSDKTDLEIRSTLSDAKWALGKKKVEYSACLLAKEAERTVVYWEMIKETGFGIPTFGGFQVETYKTDWKTRSGTVREVGYGPKGKMIDYNWDYAETRSVVEDIAKANGWKFTVTLRKGKAMY